MAALYIRNCEIWLDNLLVGHPLPDLPATTAAQIENALDDYEVSVPSNPPETPGEAYERGYEDGRIDGERGHKR